MTCVSCMSLHPRHIDAEMGSRPRVSEEQPRMLSLSLISDLGIDILQCQLGSVIMLVAA